MKTPTPAQIVKYLEDKGWIAVGGGMTSIYWRLFKHNSIAMNTPTDSNAPEYASIVATILDSLSAIEGRDASDIHRDMVLPTFWYPTSPIVISTYLLHPNSVVSPSRNLVCILKNGWPFPVIEASLSSVMGYGIRLIGKEPDERRLGSWDDVYRMYRKLVEPACGSEWVVIKRDIRGGYIFWNEILRTTQPIQATAEVERINQNRSEIEHDNAHPPGIAAILGLPQALIVRDAVKGI